MPDQRLRNLVVICFATAAWAFGFGVSSQLASHWMEQHQADNTLIGLNHSCYYLALGATSLAVPWLTRRVGPRAAALGMLACAPSLALFPWAGGPMGWTALRMLNGAASALGLIPLEALVSREARPEERARNFAFYGVALTLGGAAGIALGLYLFEYAGIPAFYVGAAAPALGSVVLLLGLRVEATAPDVDATGGAWQWQRHFLSYGTAWSQGFLEGGMLAFLTLYLKSRGLSANVAGGLMGVTTVGVILFQVPVSWLADRYGRRPMLLVCYAVAMAALLAVPASPGTLLLALGLFAFGAFSGAMYPLGLALLGDGLPEVSLARVYAWYLAMECLGSLMGSAVMGGARDLWGEASMFAVGFAALALVLAAWAILNAGRRPGTGREHDEPARVV